MMEDTRDETFTFAPFGPAGPGGPIGPDKPWQKDDRNIITYYGLKKEAIYFLHMLNI